MWPLILLALGLGAALSIYEFSPRTRSVVDDYVRAITAAHAAHQAADGHLRNANSAVSTAVRHARQAEAIATRQVPSQMVLPPVVLQPPSPAPSPAPLIQPMPAVTTPTAPAVTTPMAPAPTPLPVEPSPLPAPPPVVPPPMVPTPLPPTVADAQDRAADAAADVAVDHAASAIEANQAAAKSTAEAAQNAQTEAQRQAAAQSAAQVLEREKKIAAALTSLGVGQCGVRSFSRVTARIKNALLTRLHTEGMSVTGDNPWNINTRQYDVKLRAVWDPTREVLKLVVTAGKGGYLGLVTCDEIWKKIDPIMKGVIGG